ncbi:hypothetical protein RBWH47_02791 [Rhodopirellula baltica WH47]|uniref:Uncharacterized protein n=1 Tax=Rhodopirellula baltica WH47 TaxID=991778 RepID=F2AYI5_RHOBT|nr:hypothetical protein RBWH47_02791 [Rhodopirellula baltica WH47]
MQLQLFGFVSVLDRRQESNSCRWISEAWCRLVAAVNLGVEKMTLSVASNDLGTQLTMLLSINFRSGCGDEGKLGVHFLPP